MSILSKLTIRNLKLNKKRSIVTLIGIILSVALLVAVPSLYLIGIKSLYRYEANDKGDYHVAYYNLSKEDISSLKQNRAIDKIELCQSIGCAKTDTEDIYNTYAYIHGCTKSTLEKFTKISKGRLPQNDSELLVYRGLEKIGKTKVQLGAKVTLNIGQLADNEGILITKDTKGNARQTTEYYDNLEENLKNEQIINAKQKTYTIVGLEEHKASVTFGDIKQELVGQEYLTYIDDNAIADDNVNAFVKFKSDNVKDWAKITGSIINVDSKIVDKAYNYAKYNALTPSETIQLNSAKYNVDVNDSMIMLESSGIELLFGNYTYKLVAIIIGIIVIASVFCIKNSFDISISEKIKQYSMLKSVGATKKQIRKNIFFEASVLGIIGIPFGILAGLLPLSLLIKISNKYFMDSLKKGFRLDFEISGIAILIGVIMGVVTIFLSALTSARKASKLTILEGIRNSKGLKIKAKKLKTPKFITKFFGIGGELSHKNLKRNKKKYRTTMLSIIVSVVITIALSSFTTIMYDEIAGEIDSKDYNVSIGSHSYDDATYNKFVNTTKLDNIKDYILFRSVRFFSKDIKDDKNTNSFNSDIYVINDEQYKKYISKLGLNYNDVKNKAIFMNTFLYYDYDESTGKTHRTHLSVGLKNEKKIVGKISKDYISYNPDTDRIENTENLKDISFEIACTTDKKPFGMTSYADDNGTFFIVSDEFYKNNLKDSIADVRIRFNSSDPDKLEKEVNYSAIELPSI